MLRGISGDEEDLAGLEIDHLSLDLDRVTITAMPQDLMIRVHRGSVVIAINI